MTDPALRIACAEECGWKSEPDAYYFDRRAWRKGAFRGCTDDLPDYPNDLNACAQFEATLKYEEQPVYLLHLKRVLMRTSPTQSAAEFEQTTATARQRCEAFLKVKGRFKVGDGEGAR